MTGTGDDESQARRLPFPPAFQSDSRNYSGLTFGGEGRETAMTAGWE